MGIELKSCSLKVDHGWDVTALVAHLDNMFNQKFFNECMCIAIHVHANINNYDT